MKERLLVIRLVFALMLAGGANALAESDLISVSAGAQSPNPVCRGEAATATITVTRSGSGSADIYLSAAGLPRGVTASFDPNPVRFTGNSPVEATSTVTITTTGNTAPSSHPWRVIAAVGQSHNVATNNASLSVTLCSPGAAAAPDGSMWFAFSGTPGQDCRIEATTNLTAPDWTTLCSANFGTNSLLVLCDLDATNYPSRFYRMVEP